MSTNSGGALTNHAAAALTNVVFDRNSAADNGGAVYTDGGAVALANAQFMHNGAAKQGGAIAVASGATVDVQSTRFLSNGAPDGGAIRNLGTLSVSDTTFTNHLTAVTGSGISMTSANTTLTRVLMYGNVASNSGGAIYQSSGTLTVQDSNFVFNGGPGDGTAPTTPSGGALRVMAGTATLTGVAFVGNNAEIGGAIQHAAERSR